MEYVQGVIIGAGPSGLATAYTLQGDTVVLEKEATVGGLCRSIKRECGIFDIGGHSFHTPHPEVFELVQNILPEGLYLQRREARVYFDGMIIPYPFQKFYDRISNPEIVKACEDGLRDVRGDAAEASNFEEQIIRKFGSGIAKHFMLPYNRKLWGVDLKRISAEWTSERVAAPKGEKEKFDTTGGKRKPLQADTRVGYPQKGGYEEIYKSFIPCIPSVEVNSEVLHIDPASHEAVTSSGEQYKWEFLVSTMPLPLLVRIVEGCPDELTALADQLEYMSLREIFLLVGHQLETLIQRIYIADPVIPPHKIAFNHNSSAYLREQPCHAIMAEISISSQKQLDAETATSRTIGFLCDNGFINAPEEIVWQDYLDVEYAYPIYTHRRLDCVNAIREWLAARHIYTLGRFGEWEYINSDRCVMKGLTLGRELRQLYD